MSHSATVSAPARQGGQLSRSRLLVIFIGLILGILMAALDQTIVATALPTIAGELNGLQHISWIITVYLLAQTIAMPVYGKVGDIIGRRNAFHLAILIFLAGSVLAGIAQSMEMLIAFRAVQGIGAGGLMIGAQTIMAEIVSARERGKYMSIMGPMIGVATVLGPLLGGYLTQHATWRWIFYINLPIGIAAAVVTALALKLPHTRVKPRIDYAGFVTLAAAVGCLVLVLTWGGTEYDWTSWTIIGLGIGFVVFTPLWILAERRAAEPIIPLRLFRDDVFRINVPLAFMVGLAMFGAVSYLPTFLQLSLDASATKSGILMLPLMGGLMAAAVTTGQLVSRTGRYKVFPLIGATLAGVGMYLISLMDSTTTRGESSLYMVVLGLGIGFIMPVLVLTVQNSVGRSDVGSATAGVNFFRQIGASFGTALIGSLFISRLTDELRENLPAAAAGQIGQKASGITPAQLDKLPPQIAHGIIVSYADALTPLYAYVAPLLGVALIVALFLKEKPLATWRTMPTDGEEEPARVAPAQAAQPDRHFAPAAPAHGIPVHAVPAPAGASPVRSSPQLATALAEILDGLDALSDGDRPARQPAHGTVNGHDGNGYVSNGSRESFIAGNVYGPGRRPAAAVLTLTDLGGRQLDRAHTDTGGAYRLRHPGSGTYLLVCTPGGGTGHQPMAELVGAKGSVTRDIVLGG